jgi:hypothetical protein
MLRRWAIEASRATNEAWTTVRRRKSRTSKPKTTWSRKNKREATQSDIIPTRNKAGMGPEAAKASQATLVKTSIPAEIPGRPKFF